MWNDPAVSWFDEIRIFCRFMDFFTGYNGQAGGEKMKYRDKTLTPVQVGQVVKALLLLGTEKIVVKKTENGRYTVITDETPKKAR